MENRQPKEAPGVIPSEPGQGGRPGPQQPQLPAQLQPQGEHQAGRESAQHERGDSRQPRPGQVRGHPEGEEGGELHQDQGVQQLQEHQQEHQQTGLQN